MNKTEIIRTFAAQYNDVPFGEQNLALSNLAKALNLKLLFEVEGINHRYSFHTFNGAYAGRKVAEVTLLAKLNA